MLTTYHGPFIARRGTKDQRTVGWGEGFSIAADIALDAVETALPARPKPGAQVQLNVALAGLGIAFLPTLMTKPYLDTGRLIQVLPGHGLHGVGVYFVYLSRRELPRAVKAFMDFTVAQMRGERLELYSSATETERPSEGGARGAVAS
jgi:DNA-binding transcriptional LysR family regulator